MMHVVGAPLRSPTRYNNAQHMHADFKEDTVHMRPQDCDQIIPQECLGDLQTCADKQNLAERARGGLNAPLLARRRFYCHVGAL